MRWIIRSQNEQSVEKLKTALAKNSLICRTLAARGMTDAESARNFFSGVKPESPFALTDIDKAARRIGEAIEAGERIAVFGDYDVDGITAAAVMHTYLEASGADITVALPVRDSDGYGLSNEVIDRFAHEGATLLITVDNGIAAYDEVEYAASLGIDTVVCDHHITPARLPRAVAVVDPLRNDDASAFKELAGVGVALKLICAVEGCEVGELLDMFGPLAAIGTIADIMPLVGENRLIVNEGLARLREGDNLGLAALCEVAGIDIASIDCRKVAFGIAPRLNAAGRMGDAFDSFRLLTTDDPELALEIASKLNDQNIERQQTEREISELIDEQISRKPEIASSPVIVVSGEGYHSGVIGIVASRLVEKYDRPAIVIATSEGEGKGSGRSLKGFSLFDALSSCSDLLVKFGGHELAAGLTIRPENIDAFRKRLSEYCASLGEMPTQERVIDAIVGVNELILPAVAELSELEPFGNGNETPLFAVENAVVRELRPLSDGRHTKITLALSGGELSLAQFSISPDNFPFKVGSHVDAAFYASIKDGKWLSLQAVSVMPAGFAALSRYEAFRRGETDLPGFSLARGEVAAVWRSIEKGERFADPFDLAAGCPGLSAAKAQAAADVLCELGLAASVVSAGRRVYRPVDGAEKTQLDRSLIFNSLNGN